MKSAFACQQLCHNSVFAEVRLITGTDTETFLTVMAHGGKMSLEDLVILGVVRILELESKQQKILI